MAPQLESMIETLIATILQLVIKVLNHAVVKIDEGTPQSEAVSFLSCRYTVSHLTPLIQRLYREMIVWYRLLNWRHRNIVPFFGFIRETNGGIGLVSTYFSGGNITAYLRLNPSSNRDSLVS